MFSFSVAITLVGWQEDEEVHEIRQNVPQNKITRMVIISHHWPTTYTPVQIESHYLKKPLILIISNIFQVYLTLKTNIKVWGNHFINDYR